MAESDRVVNVRLSTAECFLKWYQVKGESIKEDSRVYQAVCAMKADKSRDVRDIVSAIKFGEPKKVENIVI